jgi:glycosyltransferase involved in cell wall biosynthesis
MAMARPLVAPAFGGAAEMAAHEVSALLFTPGDATALTAAIVRLAEDATLGARLGAAARQHALATFAVATHAERVQAVYDQLLTPAPGSGRPVRT